MVEFNVDINETDKLKEAIDAIRSDEVVETVKSIGTREGINRGPKVNITFTLDMPGTRQSMGSHVVLDENGNLTGGKIRYGAIPTTVTDDQNVSFNMRRVMRRMGIEENGIAVRVWTWKPEVGDVELPSNLILPHHDIMRGSHGELMNLVGATMDMFDREYGDDLPSWVDRMREF